MTTHAMEEAESISTKIAIQVSGFFRSFGSLAQVQREGKEGYFVDINFDLDALMPFFSLT
jgi:ABC-type multidrug transport system ATPase subunit